MSLEPIIYQKLAAIPDAILRAEYSRGTIEAVATENIPADTVVTLAYNAFTLEATPVAGVSIGAAHLEAGFVGYSMQAVTSGQNGVFEVVAGTQPVPVMPSIGDSFYGGYFAGVIDTTQGNIITPDAYQVGSRYALILSPKTLQSVAGLQWRTSLSTILEAATRWDGLSAQRATKSGTFPAFNHCAGLSYPSDGASEWYLPALDEMELLYRHFKYGTGNNNVNTGLSSTFPDAANAWDNGENPSSDPPGAAYTITDPAQTLLVDFQTGGTEVMSAAQWTATWRSSQYAWMQSFSVGGYQAFDSQNASIVVRPVRRIELPEGL